MKSTASAALISAEKTAARPSAPTAGGSPRIRMVGSARSAFSSDGNSIRAAMPRITGTAAYRNSPSALSPTPIRTARSSRAPKIFCSSPGETMKAGVRSASHMIPGGPACQKVQ